MARSIKLTKKSLTKIENCCKELTQNNTSLFENLYNVFYNIVFTDVKLIKDCAESAIVDFYIITLKDTILNNNIDLQNIFEDDNFWSNIKHSTRQKLVRKYISDKTFDNNIDIYFNEVKREYILHPQAESEDLKFCEENKDVFIKNNLKLVIECAKRYQGLGLPFEDLIQAGNVGLLTAFEKFDTERANLRFSIIDSIKKSDKQSFTFEEAEEIIRTNFSYTKLLDQTLNKIPKNGFESKHDFIDWAHINIKSATFSSISFAWIRAYIIAELNKYAKIIRGIKSKDDDEDDGKVSIIRLDSINPYTDDNYSDGQMSEAANTEFAENDESIEKLEYQQMCKDILEHAFSKMPGLNRRIIKKRFGIDFPFEMSIQEIADSEGININQIKYLIKQSLKIIQNNVTVEDKKTLMELFS